MCMYLKKRRKKRPGELLFIRNNSSLQLSAAFLAPSFESHKICNWIILQKLLRWAMFNQRRWRSEYFKTGKSERFLFQESWRNWVWGVVVVKGRKTEPEPARRRGGTWIVGWIGRKCKYAYGHHSFCFALHHTQMDWLLFLPHFLGLRRPFTTMQILYLLLFICHISLACTQLVSLQTSYINYNSIIGQRTYPSLLNSLRFLLLTLKISFIHL